MNEDNLLARYERHLQLVGVAKRTPELRRYCAKSLFQFLKLEPDDIAQVTVAQLRAFVSSLQERGLASSTLAGYVQAIKAFFGYALSEGYLQRNPADRLPNPKVGRRLPRTLTPDEARAFFAAIERGQSQRDRRNLVVFHLCYVCGLRISEAASVRRERVDLENGTLRVIGKGNKERVIYLKPKTVALLAEYLAKHNARDYLFSGRQAGHISATALEAKFQQYVKSAGLSKRITPHALRHSVAVHYLMGGAPISFVQQLLGHESLETTGIYTRLTDAMTKQVALRTKTAVDGEGEKQERGKVLKEARAAYGDESLEWETLLEAILGEPLAREHNA